MQPRTPLPPADRCPRQSPGSATLGSEGWPFPNYSWNEEGHNGHVSHQPCPEGQLGIILLNKNSILTIFDHKQQFHLQYWFTFWI